MEDHPRALLLHPNDGCVTLARHLLRRGVEVHMLATAETRWLTKVRGVHAHVLPALPSGQEQWLARLAQLADRAGVLIPASDAACELLSRRRGEISPQLRSFEAAGSAHLPLMDKERLYLLANEAGVRAPWTRSFGDHAALERMGDATPMPCVVKGVLGHEAKHDGHGTTYVESAEQLRVAVAGALDDGHRVLATEHVPGPESALEGAVVVRSADRGYTLQYGRRKLRQYPPDYGVGTLVVSDPVPETITLARRLLEHAGFEGVASVETKRHAGSGEVVLIEVNVRIPQNFGLASVNASDGCWRLYATLAGLPLGAPPEPRAGIKVLLPQLDAMAVRARIRRGDLTLLEALRSLRGVRDASAFTLRDPAPGLHAGLALLRGRLP